MKVKGYDKKIPFVYGIDYLTHDIPLGMLLPSENFEALKRFFKILKILGYPLRVVIADDILSLRMALSYVYHRARIQLCHNHYLENIRRILNVRTEEKYRIFFYALQKYVFSEKDDKEYLTKRLDKVLSFCRPSDELTRAIVIDIFKRKDELFAYQDIPNCPRTTNLIEAYNSHLQGRLKTIKGFKSFRSAESFLNAWLVRRRTKAFTDCKEKFKYLNGKTSLSQALKRGMTLPEIYPKNTPKT